MAKYKFIKERDDNKYSPDRTRVEICTEEEVIDDLLEQFSCFLAACGFSIRMGEIQYIPEREDAEHEQGETQEEDGEDWSYLGSLGSGADEDEDSSERDRETGASTSGGASDGDAQ